MLLTHILLNVCMMDSNIFTALDVDPTKSIRGGGAEFLGGWR